MPGDGVDGADGPGEDGAAEALETAADASPAGTLHLLVDKFSEGDTENAVAVGERLRCLMKAISQICYDLEGPGFTRKKEVKLTEILQGILAQLRTHSGENWIRENTSAPLHDRRLALSRNYLRREFGASDPLDDAVWAKATKKDRQKAGEVVEYASSWSAWVWPGHATWRDVSGHKADLDLKERAKDHAAGHGMTTLLSDESPWMVYEKDIRFDKDADNDRVVHGWGKYGPIHVGTLRGRRVRSSLTPVAAKVGSG
eukprot:m.89839 g.89839  ORF g.89839 m.89839 type:complete len:257 (-) comp11782_c0_seq2:1376-2146(-)